MSDSSFKFPAEYGLCPGDLSAKSLAEYEKILPGAAERIITMVEKERAHQLEVDAKVRNNEELRRRRREWFTVILVFMIVLFGMALAIARV